MLVDMLKFFGGAAVLVVLMLIAGGLIEQRADTPTAAPSSATRAAAVHERKTAIPNLSSEELREQERQDVRERAIALNKSLGVMFVRDYRIKGTVLSLTLDGNIWVNQSDGDRAALYAQLTQLWDGVFAKYNEGSWQSPVLRLYDLDGTPLELNQQNS